MTTPPDPHDAHAVARWALRASATWRSWPRGEDVPAPVRAALEVLGVRVGW